MRTGIANLPLHYGNAPKWLFSKMVKLAEGIAETMVYEYGEEEFLRKLSNPFWFQALGCVLGFDWHSSGLTTTTCGALKEALNKANLGIQIAGGKGKTSRKTIYEIENTRFDISTEKINNLIRASKLSAKVDNNCIQDGYQLYHHCFIFTEKGKWAVVQQGMNTANNYARRYHWLSDDVRCFVEEPHSAICCDEQRNNVLNMTAKESAEARAISVDLVNDNYFGSQRTLNEFIKANKEKILSMKSEHPIFFSDMSKQTIRALQSAYEIQPKNYEELVSLRGVGPKSIRALALVSEIIYGKPPSYKDPVKFAFAHGGKDGFPYPVDRKNYDNTISILKKAIENAKLGDKERLTALKRLAACTQH